MRLFSETSIVPPSARMPAVWGIAERHDAVRYVSTASGRVIVFYSSLPEVSITQGDRESRRCAHLSHLSRALVTRVVDGPRPSPILDSAVRDLAPGTYCVPPKQASRPHCW